MLQITRIYSLHTISLISSSYWVSVNFTVFSNDLWPVPYPSLWSLKSLRIIYSWKTPRQKQTPQFVTQNLNDSLSEIQHLSFSNYTQIGPIFSHLGPIRTPDAWMQVSSYWQLYWDTVIGVRPVMWCHEEISFYCRFLSLSGQRNEDFPQVL